MASRTLPTLVLIIAAAASIATSVSEPRWYLLDAKLLQSTALDTQRTKAVYALRSELRGAGPYTDLQGNLTVAIDVRAETVPTSTVTLQLKLVDERNPSNVDTQMLTLPNHGVGSIELHLPVWLECSNAECSGLVETQRLTIERVTSGTMPALIISGSVQLDASGHGEQTPADASPHVEVSVAP